jgi:hypothetical protein
MKDHRIDLVKFFMLDFMNDDDHITDRVIMG